MLVLKRQTGEGVRIGDDVLVTVLEIVEATDDVPQHVRIGFLAPESKLILREELWNKNQVEKADAAD